MTYLPFISDTEVNCNFERRSCSAELNFNYNRLSFRTRKLNDIEYVQFKYGVEHWVEISPHDPSLLFLVMAEYSLWVEGHHNIWITES